MGTCCNGSGAWCSMMLAAAVGAGVAVAVMSGVDGSGTTAKASVPTTVAQPEDQPDPMEMMNAWIEAGTPDEHHQLLEAFVGEWTAHSVTTMVPGEDPMESEGHETNEMILGGRYLFTHHKGNFGDMEFEGSGVMGYDKIGKKWVSAWVDNFSTMIGSEIGTYDKATRTWTMKQTMKDPKGNDVHHKALHKIISDNKRTMTFFERTSDGDEWHQSMLITYTRN